MVAGCEHGLKAGEVGTASWDDVAGMKQLAIQFLNVIENVCETCPPFMIVWEYLAFLDGPSDNPKGG